MNHNFYFNKNNILSCFTKEEIQKSWNELLKKADKNLEDFFDWHKKYTPWFHDEINKEIALIEYNKILKKN